MQHLRRTFILGILALALVSALLPLRLLRAAPATAIDAESQRVVELTNQERAKQGLAPLTINDKLVAAAQEHSTDMAVNNFMSHTGSDGSSPGDRITRASYQWRTYGENVAAGYPDAAAVMNGWMNSSGHRANILNANFTEIGVALADNPNSTYHRYWTMVLAAPRSGTSPTATPRPPTATPTATAPTATATAVPPTATPQPGAQTIFSDDFETSKGWTVNPSGADTAATGQWERGDPQGTSSSGAKQLGTTVSGANDLVTGRLAGSSPGSYDIDGGATSIRSPAFTLTGGSSYRLSFSSYLAYGSNSSSDDYLRVKVVGSTTTTVFERRGAAANANGAWAPNTVNLDAFAGQTVYLVIEAADAGSPSLVEAGIDDVRVTAQ